MKSLFTHSLFIIIVCLSPFFSLAQKPDGKILLIDGTEIPIYNGYVTNNEGTLFYRDVNNKSQRVNEKKVQAMKVGNRYFARVTTNKRGTGLELLELKFQNDKIRVFAYETNYYTLYFLDKNNQLTDIGSMRVLNPRDLAYKHEAPNTISKLSGHFPNCPDLKKALQANLDKKTFLAAYPITFAREALTPLFSLRNNTDKFDPIKI